MQVFVELGKAFSVRNHEDHRQQSKPSSRMNAYSQLTVIIAEVKAKHQYRHRHEQQLQILTEGLL